MENLNCAHCGASLAVFVESSRLLPSGERVRATYFKCSRCAQVQITEAALSPIYTRVLPGAESLDQFLDIAMAELGASMGNIQLLDRRNQVLVIAAHRGFNQDFLDHFREVSAGDGCACGLALRERKRIIVEDIESDGLFASMRPIARAAGFRAVQSTPVIGPDNRPVGMLSTHFSSIHRPTDDEFRRLAVHIEKAAEHIDRWLAP